MTMHITLSTNEVVNELLDDMNAGRTRAEAEALADYYEQLEEENGEDIELDVIAIRCEWSSYTDDEAEEAYGMSVEELKDNTTVIEVDDKYLVIDF